MPLARVSICALLLSACGARNSPPPAASTAAPFPLHICTERAVHLPGPPGEPQSRGCVATFVQRLTDPRSISALGVPEVERRYLVYAPPNLPRTPVPLVFVFPGYSTSAEGAALYNTHTRFEALADRDRFVVVYGNGLPFPPNAGETAAMPKGGFLQGCFAEHADEGIDVSYVRRIVEQLETELSIDRSRIYATGLSAGGGMSFQLALEAPDLVAAIAPVVPLPFQPAGSWLHGCHVRAGHQRVSIAMLGATDDPFISYRPGHSRQYPSARYPGMEETRNAWLEALGLSGAPQVDDLPNTIMGDSYEPDSGRASSVIERQRFGPGPDGRELWYYKATGMGHGWPNPKQLWHGLWGRFGKTNQDVDFADEAWSFFQRHTRDRRGSH